MNDTFGSDFARNIKDKRAELQNIMSTKMRCLNGSYYSTDEDLLLVSREYLKAQNDLVTFERVIREVMDFFLSWQDIVSLGKEHKIAAIKKLRASSKSATISLIDAKDTVEAYAKEKGCW